MPLPEIYKVLHPKGKQLDIPYQWRIAIIIAVVFVAQFLAYRDASKNLAQVVVEKQQLSSRSYDDNVALGQLRQQIKDLKAIKQPSSNLRSTAQTTNAISAGSDARPAPAGADASVEAGRFIQGAFAGFNKAIGTDSQCLVKITAPNDTRKMAQDVRQLAATVLAAANSKCRIEGPKSFESDPDNEKEAMTGAESGKIIFHAARGQRGADEFYNSLNFIVNVKRSYEMPKDSPPNTIWLQFGSNLRWHV